MWQEGGPTSPMSQYFGNFVEAPHNLLPNFGMAVLHVPLPGRLGYGAQFLNGLVDGRNFGQIDIDQGAEIVGQMVARGWTSPGKVGVTGCSYGGYFASQSITRHPELYAAANSQCTLLDLFSEFQYGFTSLISYLEGRTPYSDPNEIALNSPINRAANVRTPLLLFHGTADFLPVGNRQEFPRPGGDERRAGGSVHLCARRPRAGRAQQPVRRRTAAAPVVQGISGRISRRSKVTQQFWTNRTSKHRDQP